jgi:hypothetical protein
VSGRKLLQLVALLGSLLRQIDLLLAESIGSVNITLKYGFLLPTEMPVKDVVINSGSISV